MDNNSKLELNEKSLKTELSGYKDEPLKVLSEYIWNSFDANASIVNLNFEKRKGTTIIDDIIIKDNGEGWDFTQDETKYFLSSSKPYIDNQSKTLPHGKLGRGRYTFIWFADELEVLSNGKKMILHKNVSIDNSGTSNILKGTEVRLNKISDKLSKILDSNILNEYLCLEFGWFLKGNKNLKIIINDEELDYSSFIKNEYNLSKIDFSEELKNLLDNNTLDVSILLWNNKPKEFSKFFIFKDNNSNELFTKGTGLNKKKDNFWHSVYIYSKVFEENDLIDNFDEDNNQLSLEISANRKIKRKIFNEIKNKLVEIRRPILISNSEKVVKDLHTEESIPNLNDYGIYDEKNFDNLLKEAYVIAPSLFSGNGIQERKFVCNTFAALLSSSDSGLIKKLLEQVFGLEKEDKEKLEELLNRTNLSNIVKTTAEIQGRLDRSPYNWTHSL